MLNRAYLREPTQVATTPMSLEQETRLVCGLQAGDQEDQELFVRQFAGQMLTLARRYCRCEQDAADAVQDAFISAFKAINQFSSQSRLSTWLHRITINACLMKIRTQRNRLALSIEDLLPKFDAHGHHAEPVARWQSDTVEELASAELRAHVRTCIDQLPETYRTVLLLRDIEQYDTEETASILSESVSNVKTRLHRARQALRTMLEPLMV